MWKQIEALNWGSDNDYKRIKKIPTSEALKEFAVAKRKELQEHLDAVDGWVEYWARERNEPMSDDGFWDVTANIVGHGEEAFNAVIRDWKEVAKYGRVENFEYGFAE